MSSGVDVSVCSLFQSINTLSYSTTYAATKELDMDFRNLHTALLPFVQAYSSALERAKRDRFHWERLAMVFHPIEPDVVGLLAMIRSALRRIPVSHIDFLDGLPISHDALTVLHYCIEHTTSRPDNRWQGRATNRELNARCSVLHTRVIR